MSANILAGPKESDVVNVDRELESLWKSLPPSKGGAEARSSVINLIAVTDSTAEADAALEVIGRMIGRSPCRAIVIDSQPEVDPPGLKTEVCIIAEPAPFGSHQVCCEAIRLSATGFSADGLPSATIALHLANLPIMLWWSSPPFERDDFKRYSADVDRLVVDSAELGRDGLQALAKFIVASRKMRTAVSDLNWSRLTPYRQLFAQFFDSPNWRDQLDVIEMVTIEAHESAGLLMAGWLLSRLDKRISPNKIDIKIKNGGEAVFSSMIMKCAGGEFKVVRVDHEMVEANANVGNETVSRNARIPLASVDKLLADEIGYAGRDRAFDSAMEWVSMIAMIY